MAVNPEGIKPLSAQVIIEHYPGLESPHDSSGSYLPTEVVDEFGTEKNGFFIDQYVTFQKKDLRKVIHALRRHGYICRRADRKLDEAKGF